MAGHPFVKDRIEPLFPYSSKGIRAQEADQRFPRSLFEFTHCSDEVRYDFEVGREMSTNLDTLLVNSTHRLTTLVNC